MSKIHYTELFYSIQGEGMYAGVPSVFLRTFGCNFRCNSFGLKNKITGDNPEVTEIIKNLDQYTKFEDLPIVTTGCDSYSTVYPKFKKFATAESADIIADKMLSILPEHKWVTTNGNDTHLVITGGEPLLGWQKLYPALLEILQNQGLQNLTFETNGTQELTNEFTDYLSTKFTHHGQNHSKLTFSVSPKLSCSGETWEESIRPNVIKQYELVGNTYLKFVVASVTDVEEVKKAVSEYRAAGFNGPVYLMPSGGDPIQYHKNSVPIAELALKFGYRYSPRLQVDIWKNAWAT